MAGGEEIECTINDLTKELLWRAAKERDTADQELIKNDPHGPPVYRLTCNNNNNNNKLKRQHIMEMKYNI